METDLALTLGVVLALLSAVSGFQAYYDGRPPRLAAIFFVVSALLIILAVQRKPGGYRIDEIPAVMVQTVTRALR